MKQYRLIWCLLLLVPAGYAQTGYQLNIRQTDSAAASSYFRDFTNFKSTLQDTFQLQKELRKVLFNLYEEGFIAASFDSFATDSGHVEAFLTLNKKYEWLQLYRGNVPDEVLSYAGYRDRIYREKPFRPQAFESLLNKILNYYENNGYPFASIQIDSVSIRQNKVTARLLLQKNRQIVIDSISLGKGAGIAPIYIYNYLGIEPGGLYNEKKIRNISTRIKELPFLYEEKPHKVIFNEQLTRLQLHLKKKKASNFSGILGVLPDDETGKIQLTGDVQLKLQNALQRGELIELNWRSLQQNSQDLYINMAYPFLFNTPFGINASIKIYKRDTLFTDFYQNLSIQYLLSGNSYFEAFVQRKNSSLLSSRGYANIQALPEYADISTTAYGLGYNVTRLDYRINPRKGFQVKVNGSLGSKNIRENPDVNPEIYDSLQLTTVQYAAEADVRLFVPVINRSTILFRLQGGYLNNANTFENELYRIGGLKTLRGFDEESIFVSSYSILTVEYRFILEQNSYFYLFWDGAYYEKKTVNTLISDLPFGFGAGVSFETRPGIFSINYALGRQLDNPILLRSGKIHFGFVNYF